MTTPHPKRAHYAEPKGKSGPVIVVKKGEVMSEPKWPDLWAEYEDGKIDLEAFAQGMYDSGHKAGEQEARANADLELREALVNVNEERDMAEAYYKTLEAHLRAHGCLHDFGDVAENPDTAEQTAE